MPKRLKFPKKELNFRYTFLGGQCFRWKEIEQNRWIGVFAHTVWTLWQEEDYIIYETTPCNGKNVDEEHLLKHYLRLDEPTSLTQLYQQWSNSDKYFNEAATKFPGVRMVRQHPVENLFTFICSSNNTITRITSMVEKLCRFYGEKIAVVNGTEYYDFPSIERLADMSVQKELEKAAFGYRSKFIQNAAHMIMEFGGLNWIENLTSLSYQDAKVELMKLPGIGAKVADCICLMSLNHLQAIPVDTHVFQIASKNYLPQLKTVKSVTNRVYNEIGDHFRSLYGSYAGWPHCVLFLAELRVFQNVGEINGATKRKKNPKEQLKMGRSLKSKK